MAKFVEVSKEIENIVNEVSDELGFAQMGIGFKPIGVSKANEPVKVALSTDRERFLSNGNAGEVLVFVYEEAFDRLGYDDEAAKTKYMWIRMAMDVVTYDMEKDKLNIKVPMIQCPQGFYAKFGAPAIQAAELGLLTIQQLKDEEKNKKPKKNKDK